MKPCVRAAFAAFASIAPPDLKFYPTWNETIVLLRRTNGRRPYVVVLARDSKFELENPPQSRSFCPTVNQLKYSVIDPDPGPDLFENSDFLRMRITSLVLPCRLSEKPILGQRTPWIYFRLIDPLGIRYCCGFRAIMPLIDENPAVVFDSIGIGSAWPDAHEDYALASVQTVVHSPLEIHTDRGTHFHVGDDIAGFEFICQSDSIIKLEN
jgi:hypothetical protein